MIRWRCFIGVLTLLIIETKAQTGDCDTTFVYLNQNTYQATKYPSVVSIGECEMTCMDNSSCLSYNWNPFGVTSKCWLQIDPAPEAYIRRPNTGITNVELPCHVPDAGCSYHFTTGVKPSNAGSDVNIGQLNLCHEQCVVAASCQAWTWNMTGTPRCLHYTEVLGTTNTAFMHLFQLTCETSGSGSGSGSGEESGSGSGEESGSGSGEESGSADCNTTFVYLSQHTIDATPYSTVATIQDCLGECITNTSCLSFNWNPFSPTSYCWLQLYPSMEAYIRYPRTGLTNYEMACRVPDEGCPYTFTADTEPTNSGTDAGISHLDECHTECVDEMSCTAWAWNETGPPRCWLYTEVQSTTTAMHMHLYELDCMGSGSGEESGSGSGVGSGSGSGVGSGSGSGSGSSGETEAEDCDDTFIYLGQITLNATPNSTVTSIADCLQTCLDNSLCLSFNWDPFNVMNKKCWLQFDPAPNAYDRQDSSGKTNFELACRVPDAGCPYQFTPSKEVTGSFTDPGVDQLGQCHEMCVMSATCIAWTWDVAGPTFCRHYDSIPGTNTATFTHLYELDC